jgi:hypothetical protein
MWIARIVSFFSPPSSVFPAGGPPHGVGDEARRAEAVTAQQDLMVGLVIIQLFDAYLNDAR